MGVGQNIKKWRERRFYSQAELARLVGISANSIYRIEKETYNPRPQTVRKIAEVLAVSLEELTQEADNKNSSSPIEADDYTPEIAQIEPEPVFELAEEDTTDNEAPQPIQYQETDSNAEQISTEQNSVDTKQPINNFDDQTLVSSKRPLNKTAIALGLLVIVVLGLILWNVFQFQQLNTLEASESLDQLGLNLLTSTETQNDRLNPIKQSNSQSHGHWFHQKGINTEVFVIEFMPALSPSQDYYGWQQFNDGSWHEITQFTPDSKGYARVVVTGSDGSQVHKVEVTRQSALSDAPSGTVVLAYP